MSNNAAAAANIAASVSPDYASAIGHTLFFVGGSLITLLASIFDATRRTALKLAAGCMFGGVGALLAGWIMEGRSLPWQLTAAGIAGVMTENIVLGFMNASKQFAESPLTTITNVVKDIIPSLPGMKKD
jgi:hypothetical protein